MIRCNDENFFFSTQRFQSQDDSVSRELKALENVTSGNIACHEFLRFIIPCREGALIIKVAPTGQLGEIKRKISFCSR